MSNDNLNAEIARLLGWTNIEPCSLVDGKMTYSGLNPNGSRTMRVPDYAGDPGAALGLLEHITSLSQCDHVLIKKHRDFYEVLMVVNMAKRQTVFQGTDTKTLSQAIAPACRNALVALSRVGAGADDGAADRAAEDVGS